MSDAKIRQDAALRHNAEIDASSVDMVSVGAVRRRLVG